MVGKGHNLRHPVYVDDLVHAFELAATREGIEGEVFVIASAEFVTLEKLISCVQQVEKIHFRPIKVPPVIMRPACHAMEILAKLSGREPPFSRRSLKFFIEDSAFDIGKARRQLGYRPRFDLIAGLEKTWNSIHGRNPA
jgi:nucleoside-diphosphate-sugar epimerase